MGFQTASCKASWTPYFSLFILPCSPLSPRSMLNTSWKTFPTRDSSFSNKLGIFNTDFAGRGRKTHIFFRGSNSFAKGCMSITYQILMSTRQTSFNLQMTLANWPCNSIDLAVKYLQKDLDKLARWCAKWRIKRTLEKAKVIIFSRSTNAVRAEPALSLHSDLLSYYPHIKFPGITHDSKMTFVKHFEDILHRCTKKILSFKDIGQQVGPKPHNHFTDLQIVCKTNIRTWNCFYNDGFRLCNQQTSEFKALSLGEHFVFHNGVSAAYYMKPLDFNTSKRELSL